MNKKVRIMLLCLGILMIFSACGPVKNPQVGVKIETGYNEGKVAGFWDGLWHGLISPITFIVSLFTHDVNIYEVHNNGNWYNFGFVLGAGLFLQGGILGTKSNRS
jgi:hypothetical protein